MNSESSNQSGDSKDNGSGSSSTRIANPDNNANINSAIDESKGAIPKSRLSKPNPKKTNNNIEESNIFNNGIARNEHFTNGGTSSSPYFSTTTLGLNGKQDLPCSDPLQLTIRNEEKSLNIPLEHKVYNGLMAQPCISDMELNGTSHEYNEHFIKDTDSSSEDNELLSLSDDGCIYTYKGDHVADLPSSFFNLEIQPIEEPQGTGREEGGSPEMDFLEMDFDPGPSGDADSDSISNAEIDNAANLPLDSTVEKVQDPQPCCSHISKDIKSEVDPSKNDSSKVNCQSFLKTIPEPLKVACTTSKSEMKMPWSCSLSERTRTAKSLRVVHRHHSSRGELVSPSELLNTDVNMSNVTSKNMLLDKKPLENDGNNMIWSHQEACLKQITQLGPSACGATAVLNVLNALRFPIPSPEKVQECISTRLRANSSPLAEYLLSRSKAGCHHNDLIAGLYKLSNKRIYSRFFSMHPERIVNLKSWLGYWIANGAVPIATLNLQKCEGTIPDSWHHQMIFGVGSEGIYLTNPLECVDPDQLWPQLTSESVLLVRTEDVIARWNKTTDLPQLMEIDDVRWKDLNVIGQVARVVRAHQRETRVDYVSTAHIKIPADYKAGITLAIDMNSPAFALLHQCPELPLLQEDCTASAF